MFPLAIWLISLHLRRGKKIYPSLEGLIQAKAFFFLEIIKLLYGQACFAQSSTETVAQSFAVTHLVAGTGFEPVTFRL